MRNQLLLAALCSACAVAYPQVNRVQQAREVVNQVSPGTGTPVQATFGGTTSGTVATRSVGAPYIPPTGVSQGANLGGMRRMAGSAQRTAGQASSAGLSKAINLFYMDVGRLPKTTEGLDVLLTQPPGVKNWKGPYITRVSGREPFTDPWGNLYRYENTTMPGAQPTFKISSNGPDGLPDTTDDLSISG